jgi:cell division protein FtsB
MARGARTVSIPRRRATSRKPAGKSTGKSTGKTAAGAGRKVGRKSNRKSGPPVLGDMTRPTPRQERLVPKLLGRAALALGALLVVGAFANSFLVLPVRSWFGQQTEIDERQRELDTLRAATDELQTEVDRLRTPEGLEDAAREELGFVIAGEERLTVIGESEAPLDLPSGWPYDMVEGIVATRVAHAAATSATTATTANPTP